MEKKKNKNKKIGKVNPVLYAILYPFVKRKYTKKYHLTMDKALAKEIKGPAIVVASHTCDMDHFLTGLTLYPVRPTYIVSEHFIHNPSTAKFMKLMHVITKKMFTADISTIKNILRAKKENAVIVIFPEGRLSCYGRTLPVAEGTAELIKKLGGEIVINSDSHHPDNLDFAFVEAADIAKKAGFETHSVLTPNGFKKINL
jgi:1-acyl-sn-glycerol-3-phosphate acyltransferase